MHSFSLVRPTTAQKAVSTAVQSGGGARFVAGGTTLYDLMKLNIERPRQVIDIAGIAELGHIETNGDHLRFGALARRRLCSISKGSGSSGAGSGSAASQPDPGARRTRSAYSPVSV
jgi:CO/xanthine dehydrogenase FAD-binding subunit